MGKWPQVHFQGVISFLFSFFFFPGCSLYVLGALFIHRILCIFIYELSYSDCKYHWKFCLLSFKHEVLDSRSMLQQDLTIYTTDITKGNVRFL